MRSYEPLPYSNVYPAAMSSLGTFGGFSIGTVGALLKGKTVISAVKVGLFFGGPAGGFVGLCAGGAAAVGVYYMSSGHQLLPTHSARLARRIEAMQISTSDSATFPIDYYILMMRVLPLLTIYDLYSLYNTNSRLRHMVKRALREPYFDIRSCVLNTCVVTSPQLKNLFRLHAELIRGYKKDNDKFVQTTMVMSVIYPFTFYLNEITSLFNTQSLIFLSQYFAGDTDIGVLGTV